MTLIFRRIVWMCPLNVELWLRHLLRSSYTTTLNNKVCYILKGIIVERELVAILPSAEQESMLVTVG
jgi:hypothetical protein